MGVGQVDTDTEDGHRSHDPQLTQRQSLPERMKAPVELMQPAQRLLARSSLAYARGQSRNRGLVAPDTAGAPAWVTITEPDRCRPCPPWNSALSIDNAACTVAGGRSMCHRQIPVIQALDELGGGLGLVDCLAACRAVPARLQWRPACGMGQRLALGAAAAAPVCE